MCNVLIDENGYTVSDADGEEIEVGILDLATALEYVCGVEGEQSDE